MVLNGYLPHFFLGIGFNFEFCWINLEAVENLCCLVHDKVELKFFFWY